MRIMRKTAIITGASTGIGKAAALELAENNYEVILVARSVDKLKNVRKKIENKDGLANYYKVDLSNFDDVKSFINEITTKYKRIDAILNIAGI
jgi:short-subunit dehydrogenase